jgi:hypothetical protein
VLTNFDIYAAGGTNTAVVRDFPGIASNAGTNIIVSFTQGAADDPKICGIEILPAATVSSAPRFTGIVLSGTTLTITATNGPAGGRCYLLMSTNVALPLSQWTPVSTNTFDGNGHLNSSNNLAIPGDPQRFYLLTTP